MRFDKKRGLVFTQKHIFVYESCTLVTSIGESAPSHKGRWIWYTGCIISGGNHIVLYSLAARQVVSSNFGIDVHASALNN